MASIPQWYLESGFNVPIGHTASGRDPSRSPIYSSSERSDSDDGVIHSAIAKRDCHRIEAYLLAHGRLPKLDNSQAIKLAHDAVHKDCKKLLTFLLKNYKISPNSQFRPAGPTILAKAAMNSDLASVVALAKHPNTDLYHKIRSQPTARTCLVMSPSKVFRDGILKCPLGRTLHPEDRASIARQTTPMTQNQAQVLWHVREKSEKLSRSSAAQFEQVVRDLGYTTQDAELVRNYVRCKAPLIVNFPTKVTEKLHADPFLRNQFETGTSHGYLEPTLGGGRDGWERKLFAGIYHTVEKLAPHERPRYGSVSGDKSKRGAVGYGGAIFELEDHARSRVTICPFDSSKPEVSGNDVGTLIHANHVLIKLGSERLTSFLAAARGKHDARPDNSVRYVEMQVHGQVSLERDIKKIRLRRSSLRQPQPHELRISQRSRDFAGLLSESEVTGLVRLGERYKIKVAWRGTYHSPGTQRERSFELMRKFGWPLNAWFWDSGRDEFMFTPNASLKRLGSRAVCSNIYSTYSFHDNEIKSQLNRLGQQGVRVLGHSFNTSTYTHLLMTRKRADQPNPQISYKLGSADQLQDFGKQGFSGCAYSETSGHTYLICFRRLDVERCAKVSELREIRSRSFDDAASDAKSTGQVVMAAWGRRNRQSFKFVLEHPWQH